MKIVGLPQDVVLLSAFTTLRLLTINSSQMNTVARHHFDFFLHFHHYLTSSPRVPAMIAHEESEFSFSLTPIQQE